MSRPAAKSTSAKPPPTEEQQKNRLKSRRYYEANKCRLKARVRQRYAGQTTGKRALERWRKLARPATPKQGTWRASDPRHSAIARAYCDWSNIDEVVRMYVAAAVMTELTGQQYSVDHIVPIANPFVCGLHTHSNMQVITQAENRIKANWLWPGMPELSWASFDFLRGFC